MIRIAVMGAVNSGKTTFVNLYVKKLEKYGRTQTLSLLDSFIGDSPVQFIDCPGHSALSYAKSVSLTLADVVFYVVDSTNPNFELLTEISKHKPVLILLNRWKSTLPLKEYFQKSSENQLYSQLAEIMSSLDLDCQPFFESHPTSNCFTFPINFISGFGIKEFESYFEKYWIKIVNPTHKEYLYLVDDRNDKFKFKCTKYEGEKKISLDGMGLAPVDKFFEFNLVDKIYTLRPEFNNLFNAIYILDQDTIPPQMIKLNHEFSISKELKDILDRSSVLDVLVNIYSDTSHKLESLIQFLKKYNFRITTFTKYSFNQFKDLNLEGLKFAWVEIPVDQFDYSKDYIYSDSYYNLEDHLKNYLELKLNEYVKKQILNLKKEFVLDLLPEYVFKQDKTEFIIGVRLNLGVLTEKVEFKLKNNVKGKIYSIQHEKKKKSRWVDYTKNVAVELKFDTPWTPTEGPYKAYSLTMEQTLNKYIDTKEKEIKDECTKYKEHLLN